MGIDKSSHYSKGCLFIFIFQLSCPWSIINYFFSVCQPAFPHLLLFYFAHCPQELTITDRFTLVSQSASYCSFWPMRDTGRRLEGWKRGRFYYFFPSPFVLCSYSLVVVTSLQDYNSCVATSLQQLQHLLWGCYFSLPFQESSLVGNNFLLLLVSEGLFIHWLFL